MKIDAVVTHAIKTRCTKNNRSTVYMLLIVVVLRQRNIIKYSSHIPNYPNGDLKPFKTLKLYAYDNELT